MLWQRLLDWGKYLLKHKEQTEKNTGDLKEQQQAFDEMTAFVQRLAFEVDDYARTKPMSVRSWQCALS